MDPYNPIIAMHTAPARGAFPARHTMRDAQAWPPGAWLVLQAVAVWPLFVWTARRWSDGSDEPLGLVALALIAMAALGGRIAVRREPRARWLLAALGATALATASIAWLPPLATAAIGMLALALAYAAFRAPGSAVLPLLGLLWLALPLIASLQFYAGYPLRVLTAEASVLLLQAFGAAAEAAGASVWVDGRLVLVDAPCSGVQLAWLGYCAACAAALWQRLPDLAFARRLPLVGGVVLAGNIVRNTVLVAAEGGLMAAPGWWHEAVGLVALIGVCALVVALMGRRS